MTQRSHAFGVDDTEKQNPTGVCRRRDDTLGNLAALHPDVRAVVISFM
jgi:hypothetical protein